MIASVCKAFPLLRFDLLNIVRLDRAALQETAIKYCKGNAANREVERRLCEVLISLFRQAKNEANSACGGRTKETTKKFRQHELDRHRVYAFFAETKMKTEQNILVVGHRYRHAWERLLSLVFLMGKLFGLIFQNNTFESSWKMILSRLHVFEVAKRLILSTSFRFQQPILA